MSLRFQLDEHADHAIATETRRHGIDIITATDAGLLGASDPDVVAFALAHRRVIVTRGTDYLAWNDAGRAHAGIAWCAFGSRSVGHIVEMLRAMDASYQQEDMLQRVEYL